MVGKHLLCLAMLTVTAWSDWRYRTIPNWAVVGGCMGGVTISFWQGGLMGALSCLSQGLLVAIPMLLLYLANGLGGGDVKLVFALGSLLGITKSWRVIAIGCMLTGVHVMVLAWRKKAVRRLIWDVGHLVLTGTSLRASFSVPFGLWVSLAGWMVVTSVALGGWLGGIRAL